MASYKASLLAIYLSYFLYCRFAAQAALKPGHSGNYHLDGSFR